jgi:hypothetical protein
MSLTLSSSSSNLKLLVEVDISLVLHECGMPWHIPLLIRQLGIEVTMCGAIQSLPLVRSVFVTFVGVKEAGRLKHVRCGPSRTFTLKKYSPEASRRRGRISHPNPVCGACLSYTEAHQ